MFKGKDAEKVLLYSSKLINICVKEAELNNVWKEIIIKYNLLMRYFVTSII